MGPLEVSIPIGFSSSLQRNSSVVEGTSRYLPCFNPYRVFKFVATRPQDVAPKGGEFVSIPIGFSSSLQLYDHNGVEDNGNRFNPYRVFKFVATVALKLFPT